MHCVQYVSWTTGTIRSMITSGRGQSNSKRGWKVMREAMHVNKWFELFSCYMFCHVLQSICRKWQCSEDGRMSCQFDEIIMAIIAIWIQNGNDWMVRRMVRWAEEGGHELGNQEHTYK